MTLYKYTLCLGLLALAFAATTGCGSGGPPQEPKIAVKGKVTKGGTPITLNPQLAAAKAARREVRFLREGAGASPSVSEMAFANADGTFEVKIPKGKYRIGVQHFENAPGDLLGNKFELRSTPIVREVAGDAELNIDLDKPQGP